jgi:lipoprotein-anchoring transpeptidase ErfK/SrfK
MADYAATTRCFAALCFGAAGLVVVVELGFSQSRPSADPAPVATQAPDSTLLQAPESAGPPPKFVGSGLHQVQMVVSLSARQLTVYRGGLPIAQFPVAVGQDDWATPTGRFEVTSQLENPAWQHPITGEIIEPGPENPLGSHWIGFWSDGRSLIGFHGTNQDSSIGQAISHGCIRLRNEDIAQLYNWVTLGSEVIVQP